MKKELETIIMEQLKKGYYPVYVGEEGYVMITVKAYLAAAEYAQAEKSYFCYGDVCFEMIDVNNRSDEIEAEDYDFMPRKVDFDSSDKEVEGCKFKVGDIIRPTPEADNHYIYTGSDLIEAEVVGIKSQKLIEIAVRQHIINELIGESFYVDPAYFELAGGDKASSADDIFSDLEDIDLVYRAIDEKMSNLGGAIYYLKSWRDDLNEIRLNEKLEDLSKELNRYEAIFDRIVEYEKVRRKMEVKKE